MLKENGNKKPDKNKGRYITCSKCRHKIYIDSEEEKENITKINHTRIYECNCGNEILLD